MFITEFEIDDMMIRFVNQSYNTRSGFAHHSTMFVNNQPFTDCKKFYLNRTWERYSHESTMLGCIYNLISEKSDDIKMDIMHENGWKRMTPERRETIENAEKINNWIIFYKKIADHLKTHNCA